MEKADLKVIRKVEDKFFIAVDERVQDFLGRKVKAVTFLECDANGNISDGNHDGIISSQIIHCTLKPGMDDLDISTLREDCLAPKIIK